jgi:hypothetical protein
MQLTTECQHNRRSQAHKMETEHVYSTLRNMGHSLSNKAWSSDEMDL